MRPSPFFAFVLFLACVVGWSSVTGPAADPKTAATETGGGILYLVGAAHVPGYNDTQWRTSLEVCNFSGVTRSFQLAFLHRGQSNTDPETVDLTLAPGVCANYPDVVATVFNLDEAVGTLRLDADGDGVVATARTYNDTPDGTYGTALATNLVEHAVAEGESTALIHLAQSGTDSEGYRTNLDLLNVTEIEIAVEVALYSSDGTHFGTRSVTLQPFEYAQKTKAFRWVTGLEVADGYALIRTTTAGGAFLTAASLVDNRTGDTTTIAASGVPSSERWLEAKNLGPVINSSGDEWYPIFARDGSFMIFVAQGRGGYGSGDLYISRFVDGEWQAAENMGTNVNTSGMDSAPFLSADDRTLYFISNSNATGSNFDIWYCSLNDGVPGPRIRMPSPVNTSAIDCCPVISPDGNSIYICSDRTGGFGNLDIWMSNRIGGEWQPMVNLGATVNTGWFESPRWLSDDGTTLIIDSNRPGRIGGSDLWTTVKNGSEWLAPVNLGEPVNSPADEWGPGFIGNGGDILGRIFFGSGRPGGYGGWDIWYSDFGRPTATMEIGDSNSGSVRIPNIAALSRQAGAVASPDAETPAAIRSVPPAGGCCSSDSTSRRK